MEYAGPAMEYAAPAMEFLLKRVSSYAVGFVIKNGMAQSATILTSAVGPYIMSVDKKLRPELLRLQQRLETKINIISPAIDLVEIIAARGNTSLESALALTASLRSDIQTLGVRIADLNSESDNKKRSRNEDEIKALIAGLKILIQRIDDAVPLLNLAITTSGVNISSSIPHSVSPSRLLQASSLLSTGDTAYSIDPFKPAQIGSTFKLSLYMLFAGHAHRKGLNSATDLTWQEVIYKCHVKLQRVPLFYDDETAPEEDRNDHHQYMRADSKIQEYCYELCFIEDLDDGRVHDESKVELGAYEDVVNAGIRARIPVHQISKMFYTTSGKLLGIEESQSPILLIKRDKKAPPPRRLVERATKYEYEVDSEDEETQPGLPNGATGGEQSGEETDLPHHLDQEWLALEVFSGSNDDDLDTQSEISEDDYASTGTMPSSSPPREADSRELSNSFRTLDLSSYSRRAKIAQKSSQAVKSELSILECLLRLAILQNYQQASHLTVNDQLLNLFLTDSISTESRESRQLERDHARGKIGFDPYEDSPENYQLGRKDRLSTENSNSPVRPVGTMRVRGRPENTPIRRPDEIDSGLPAMKSSSAPMTPSSVVSKPDVDRRRRREEWTPDRQLSSEW